MAPGPSNRNRTALVVGGVVALVALVVGAVLLVGGDDDEAGPSTSTSEAPTTSTTGPTTSTSAPDPADVALAAYPDLRGGGRFDDPQALVEAFATEVLGFDTDLAVGELQQGDARSGEIEVRPGAAGATTVVPVRRISDDTWVVVAAVSDLIRLDEPAAGAAVTSPLTLRGAATAFEGHVDVALYADGQAAPIATTFVTGTGDGNPGPFEGELEFELPDGATHGVLVLTAAGGEDGTTIYATAVRVAF